MSPTKTDKSTPVDSDVELNWPFLLKFQQDHSILSAFLGKVGNKLCSGIDTWKVRRLNQSRSKAVLMPKFKPQMPISNMKISRRCLADYVKHLHQKACRTCSTIFFLIQPIKSLLWGLVVAVTSSETATTTTATKTSQICIFDNEKQYFCTLCTFIFHFLTF